MFCCHDGSFFDEMTVFHQELLSSSGAMDCCLGFWSAHHRLTEHVCGGVPAAAQDYIAPQVMVLECIAPQGVDLLLVFLQLYRICMSSVCITAVVHYLTDVPLNLVLLAVTV